MTAEAKLTAGIWEEKKIKTHERLKRTLRKKGNDGKQCVTFQQLIQHLYLLANKRAYTGESKMMHLDACGSWSVFSDL